MKKKLLAVLLVVALIMSIAPTAFAADDHTCEGGAWTPNGDLTHSSFCPICGEIKNQTGKHQIHGKHRPKFPSSAFRNGNIHSDSEPDEKEEHRKDYCGGGCYFFSLFGKSEILQTGKLFFNHFCSLPKECSVPLRRRAIFSLCA